MSCHGGDETRVVGFLAVHWRRGHDLFPDAINRRCLVEPEEESFEVDEFRGSFRGGFAQAVDVGRSGQTTQNSYRF